MSLRTCLLIMLGGAVGTLLRYVVFLMTSGISGGVPWGTIAINVAGSFVIGFFGTLTLSSGRFPVPEDIRLLVMVGVCGGFTTFSSFSLQTFDLLRNGLGLRAAVNVVASVMLCLGGVVVGHSLAARWNGGDTRVAQVAAEEETPLPSLPVGRDRNV